MKVNWSCRRSSPYPKRATWPGAVTVTFAAVIVSGSIASLKVAAIFLFSATPVALFAGSVEVTVGAVVSAVAPVVKLQTKLLASGLPARSLAPVVIVTVKAVLGARWPEGVKVNLARQT